MKDITLKIVGQLFNNEGEDDSIEFITEGRIYRRGEAFYLVYEETELTGMPGCRARLKIAPEHVKLTRSGKDMPNTTEMYFAVGEEYKTFYDTPYGPIGMEVLTNSIENGLNEEGLGMVLVDYNLSLGGLGDARNKLSIEIRE